MRCEDVPTDPAFLPLAAIDGLAVDLRYAGPRNFTGRDLYAGIDCAWLRRDAAQALAASVAWLRTHAPALQLVVLDALRPHRVQCELWDFLDGTGLRQYVADPALGSIHSYGMAVDVTLLDAQGAELDMGSGFDEMDELSHPALEDRHHAAGLLADAALANRRTLRAAMAAGGWAGIPNEWWHFECGTRAQVRGTLPRVL